MIKAISFSLSFDAASLITATLFRFEFILPRLHPNMVPQSLSVGSSSMLVVLATFLNSAAPITTLQSSNKHSTCSFISYSNICSSICSNYHSSNKHSTCFFISYSNIYSFICSNSSTMHLLFHQLLMLQFFKCNAFLPLLPWEVLGP